MSDEKAKALGYEPLAYMRAYAMAGVDIQKEHLLMGPTYSAPVCLERAGMKLADMDLVEVHEAFAAQVIATLRRFESKEHAAEARLGRADRLDRPRQAQPQRRLDRHRPPLRRHRRQGPDAGRLRNEAPQPGNRLHLDLRRRRPRPLDGARAQLTRAARRLRSRRRVLSPAFL